MNMYSLMSILEIVQFNKTTRSNNFFLCNKKKWKKRRKKKKKHTLLGPIDGYDFQCSKAWVQLCETWDWTDAFVHWFPFIQLNFDYAVCIWRTAYMFNFYFFIRSFVRLFVSSSLCLIHAATQTRGPMKKWMYVKCSECDAVNQLLRASANTWNHKSSSFFFFRSHRMWEFVP